MHLFVMMNLQEQVRTYCMHSLNLTLKQQYCTYTVQVPATHKGRMLTRKVSIFLYNSPNHQRPLSPIFIR